LSWWAPEQPISLARRSALAFSAVLSSSAMLPQS
jgi:hypothetical protein